MSSLGAMRVADQSLDNTHTALFISMHVHTYAFFPFLSLAFPTSVTSTLRQSTSYQMWYVQLWNTNVWYACKAISIKPHITASICMVFLSGVALITLEWLWLQCAPQWGDGSYESKCFSRCLHVTLAPSCGVFPRGLDWHTHRSEYSLIFNYVCVCGVSMEKPLNHWGLRNNTATINDLLSYCVENLLIDWCTRYWWDD